MKKVILAMFTLSLVIILFAGCSKTEKQEYEPIAAELSAEEEYLVSLADKAESEEDILNILEKNDSENFQIALATKSENYMVKETLLNYENLNKNALIAICENTKNLNLENTSIRECFANAIVNAELTSDEELRIAHTDKFPMQYGVICRENLSAETLIYILKRNNNTIFEVLNLEHYEMKEIVYNQVLRVSLTVEQTEELKELDIYNVNQALIERGL